MQQFDLCRLGHRTEASGSGSGSAPLVVVLQHAMFDRLDTCVVAPVVPCKDLPRIDRLRPVIAVAGSDHVIAVDRMAAIRRQEIGKAVGTAASHRDEIVAALDILFTGI